MIIDTVRGHDVAWWTAGAGPVDVVLVHGIGVSGRYFRPLAAELSSRARVVVPDLPGFGDSPRPSAPLSVEEHAQVVAGLVERLGLRRPVLVGHSMGAQVVTEVAVRRPDLTAGIVLVGPVADPRARSAVRQGLRLLRSVPYEPVRGALLQVREWLRTGPRWFAATVPGMVDYPLEDRLGEVVAPVALARGRRDRVAPLAYVAGLAARVPGAPVVQVPDAGHIAMFRSPRYVAEAALRFADPRSPGDVGPPAGLPAASAGDGRAPVLRRVVWRVLDLGFVLREEAVAFTRPDRARLREPDRPRLPPVVLVPGVYEHWTVLRRSAAVLHAAGHPVHVLPELGNNRAPIADGADVLLRFLERSGLTRAVVVAHSKGGLIGKLAMVRQGEHGRLAGVVAVATPFAGSAHARRIPLAAVRAFAPDDPLIRSLAAERAVDARIVSVYSRYDPHIPAGSRLDGAADNIVLGTPGHFRVLADPALPAVLVRAVRLLGARPRRDTDAASSEDHGHEHRAP